MAKATDRQLSLITSLLRERVTASTPDLDALSVQDASRLISELFQAPKREGVVRHTQSVSITQPGIYRTSDGSIYRVQFARGSRRLYAKRLSALGGFTYEAGAIYRIAPADLMSLAEAQAWGVASGVCCVCGRELTDPQSVTRGIGPVCAGRGWWRATD